MDGNQIYQGLLDRGYGPNQAAALTGNILQESGGNPNALNAKEGANGLLQWRLDRYDGLQNFAKARGGASNDPNTQLDFIRQEMNGPESRSAAGFLNAPDLASANAALKGYIRYGDASEGTRLANAQGILKQAGGAAPMSIAGPAESAGAPPAAPAPSQPEEPQPQQAAPAAPAGPAPAPVDLAALAAVPQLQNLLPARPKLGRPAPFSFRGFAG